MQRIVRQLGGLPVPRNLAMTARDAARIADAEIAIRGDVHSPGERVPRGFLQVTQAADAKLAGIGDKESGRLQLAQWIASRENPLTARVMVNRIWQHMFGRGIVASPDNFGSSGPKPTHPELLDYLAVRFMDGGWSVKKTIRDVALSHAYRLSTAHVDASFAKDPENKLVWRLNRRRLEAEAIRDSVLAVSGTLERRPPETSPILSWNLALDANRRGERVVDDWDRKLPYRTVYLPVVRNKVSRFLETFDFPEPSECRGKREVTTVPTQALYMMNDAMVREQSLAAAKVTIEAASDDKERVQNAYARTLSRLPTAVELDRALSYLRQPPGDDASAGDETVDAWSRFHQALFASAEFRYRN